MSIKTGFILSFLLALCSLLFWFLNHYGELTVGLYIGLFALIVSGINLSRFVFVTNTDL